MRIISGKSEFKKPLFLITVIALIIILILVFILYRHNNTVLKESQPRQFTIELGNQVTMEFVRIDSGSFMMGSFEEEGDSDETPRHKVTITKPFYIGRFEVTQEQWKTIMGENPSEFKGDQYPVDSVSWKDCVTFNQKLSNITGKRIELPSEAQWEYACRADSLTKWFFGSDEKDAIQYGWIDSNSSGSTHPVGMKEPNSWGLYDMYGNIQEWCQDWYQNPYSENDISDPTGPNEGDSRVIRGGGWGDFPDNARSSYRNASGENDANNGTGFRCILYLE